ncbi:hypothetical protein AB0A05_07400 [Streptomyces sp. NPDC046374]|uniref:hypothetical protein n=1 Tax=Streptomyces sp. NPDC046374 TaxID=3154917 RepID=UPI0033CFBA18
MTVKPGQTYSLPDIGGAAHEAIDALHAARERVGRVMAVVTALAVVDILNDHDHEAPFDAAHAEVIEADDGSLHATGRYWTAAGEERTFAEAVGERTAHWGVFEMNEWTPYLCDENESVWKPLVEELAPRRGQRVYRLDLAKAVALPVGSDPEAP